ncbi:hypothetical protein JCM3765_003354 [Sporobolomyces pararoseus]
MSSLLTGPLDFPLSSLSSLSTTQLALAKLHPDFEESEALRICQLFFHRREKARQAQQGGGGNRLDQDEDAKFALVGLDFRLDGKLEELNEEQLAAVVVLAHPDASELHVLKAERIWRKRREKLAQSRRIVPEREQSKVVEQPRAQPEPVRVSTERVPEPPKVDKPPPPTPAPSQPPQAVVVPTGPRPRKASRPLPPLPPVESRLPDTLCQEIFALKLSNLPVIEIKTRDDVSSLFPRNLLPDAVILHRPLNPDDVSRTAYVGWIFDFEKRTEAMQEVIRVRMGRWRAIAEFTDSEKPRWEWGDLVKAKRQFAWKVWNEKEQEREEKRLEEEAERKRKAEEDAVMVDQHSTKEEETRSSLVPAEPEKIQPLSIATTQGSAAPPHDLPPTDGEPEAIVLDSPALPPIPSRAPSRDGSSQNNETPSFQPPPMRPLSPVSTRTPTSSRPPLPAPSSREIRAPRSRPTSPRPSSRNENRRAPSPSYQRDPPPHITNSSRPPLGPSSSSASFSPLHLPPRPVPQHPVRQQQPQYVDNANRLPPRLPVSSSSSSASLDQPQDPKPAPPPSLLARTTELEVRGSAPTPSAASQARKPSLMDRLNGNNGSSPSTSDRGSPPVGPGRGQSPTQQSNLQPVSSSSSGGGGGRMSPGDGGRGGNPNGNNGKGKGNQGSSQLSNQNSSNSNSNSNPSRQQGQQQQQQQQSKGKKRAANNDSDSHQDQRGNQRGGGGSSSTSILNRIEGTGNNNQNGNGGGGGRGPAKKAKNNSTGGGNSRDTDQGGSSSLLSRLG